MSICVILSTYNGERYINEQLDSIFKNIDNTHIFLYVRDDGSKDNTIQILKQYKDDHNVSIIIDQGKNVGSAQSFLQAIKKCPRADYYTFCDQDDIWVEGKLETAIKRIGKTVIPVLWCSDYQVVNSKLDVIVPSALSKPELNDIKAIFYNNVPGCTMVFNYALMQEIRKMDIVKIRMHDIMAINVALITGKVYFEHKPFVLYRQHGDNVLGYNHKKIKFGKWFNDKVKLIRDKEDYSTAEYARAILKAFENKMDSQKRQEYELISMMDNSVLKRIKILRKPYTKQKIGRTSISIRSKIFLNLM